LGLFGDAASATIVSSEGNGELLASKLGADGSGGTFLISGNNLPQHPFLPEDWRDHYPPRFEWESIQIYMAGSDVYRFAVTTMPKSILDVLEEADLSIEEMDYLIPHQANYRILEASARRLDYPIEKVYTGLQTTGNTSSAGLGVGIDECLRDGRIKKGDIVGLTGFGGGLTYGALLLKI
jgi:3-oxoacyl-[acyl-carrier-protein] synthase-3